MTAEAHIVGSILGTAVGDSIGLPYEGLSRRRAARLLGPPDRHRFFFGRGMVSDDTEHTCMVAQSLIGSGADPEAFGRKMAWGFRLWVLALPAGIGFATLRSILKLWLGVGPEKSGVHSAGNGPAMRAAIIGAAVEDDEKLTRLVRSSTRITHTDPRAESGALAVALAAQMASQGEVVSGAAFLDRFRAYTEGSEGKVGSLVEGEVGSPVEDEVGGPLEDEQRTPAEDELGSLIEDAVRAADGGQTTTDFAASLGLAKGVSGFVCHTVPVAIHAWLTNQRDFRSAVRGVIQCGGDADSTGAIVGGIVGASVGREGIPEEWLDRLIEWPRSTAWMERLAVQLDTTMRSGVATRPIRLPAYGVIPRNLFFLIVILLHGARRALPPYG